MARILVIDDDNELRSILRAALEVAGHQVWEAADGAQGIRTFRQWPADIILCDVVMPVKEGLETIRELRHLFGDVKIVAMSGGAYGGTMDFLPFAAKFGAVRILKKPFDMRALRDVLEEVLQGPVHDAEVL